MCDTDIKQSIDPNYPLTLEELKEYLRISEDTLKAYLSEGLGREGFKVGKSWRFMPLDVIVWLKDRHKRNYKASQNILSKNELKLIALKAKKAQQSNN
jgi:hypothetical protein